MAEIRGDDEDILGIGEVSSEEVAVFSFGAGGGAAD